DHGVTPPSNGSARRAHRRTAREATRGTATSPPTVATLDPRERLRFSTRTPGHAVPTRAYQPRHNASTTAGALPRRKRRPANAGLQAVQLDEPHSIRSSVLGR